MKLNAFTVNTAKQPSITSVTPSPAYVNSTFIITIKGQNFQPEGGTFVYLVHPTGPQNIQVSLISLTATQLNGTVTIPADAPTSALWKLNVTTLDGGISKPFAVTIKPVYPPTIGTITPATGYPNGTISYTLKGTNFQPGMTTVDLSNPGFGELNTTIYSITATQIIGGISFPANAPTGTWRLNVTTPDGGKTSRVSAFTVNKMLPPTITSFTPATGYRGTTVSFIVNGKYFQPGGRTTVNLSQPGAPEIQTTLSSVYSSQIYGTVSIPEGATTGPWKVNVSTLDGGNSTLVNAIKVL